MNAMVGLDRHDAIRRRLQWLSQGDDPLVTVLNTAGPRRGWWPPRGDWRRSYARCDPHLDVFCTLLYETTSPPQALCLVEMTEHRPRHGDEGLCLHDPESGWLRLSPFPADALLSTLPQVLQWYPDHQVIRYRPHRRCTLRVQHGAQDKAVFYVKVFADPRGDLIQREGLALLQAASRGRLGFRVARPLGWNPRLRAVMQGCVTGAPVVASLFSADGIGLAHRMGQACGTLPRSGLRPATRFDRLAQYERTARYATELMRRLPGLRAQVQAFLGGIAQWHKRLPRRALRPIHGAPHAHQWLDDGQRLGLIDFDRICLGDPELDVATFVAEVDFEDPGLVPVEALADAFIAGYEQEAGPLCRPLMEVYRAHKRLAKALKAARGVRLDAAGRARRNLDRAVDCLRRIAA